MPDSYTVLWTNDSCRWLKKNGATGQPLRVLFGGSHQSAPSFTRFGVQAGDVIYPVGIRRCTLHIITRMKVGAIVSVEDYLRKDLGDTGINPNDHLWVVEDGLLKRAISLQGRVSPLSPESAAAFERLVLGAPASS
jgi:hypothetical protein